MTVYVAEVERDGPIRIYRVDGPRDVLTASIPLPTGAGLRSTLLDAGWRPTGRRARGGWGAIFVTPAEDRPHPTGPPPSGGEDVPT